MFMKCAVMRDMFARVECVCVGVWCFTLSK